VQVSQEDLEHDYFKLYHLPQELLKRDPALSSFEAWAIALRRARTYGVTSASGMTKVFQCVVLSIGRV
jgi:hypothetical protein